MKGHNVFTHTLQLYEILVYAFHAHLEVRPPQDPSLPTMRSPHTSRLALVPIHLEIPSHLVTPVPVHLKTLVSVYLEVPSHPSYFKTLIPAHTDAAHHLHIHFYYGLYHCYHHSLGFVTIITRFTTNTMTVKY